MTKKAGGKQRKETENGRGEETGRGLEERRRGGGRREEVEIKESETTN